MKRCINCGGKTAEDGHFQNLYYVPKGACTKCGTAILNDKMSIWMTTENKRYVEKIITIPDGHLASGEKQT